MKTKKDILKWWQDLGKNDLVDDLGDFLNVIDGSIYYEIKNHNDNKYSLFTLTSKRWKYPLRLHFIKNECVRIVGF